MAEYIEREWLVKEAEAILNFRKQYYMDRNRIADAADTVEWLKYYAPAADVVEVVHGEWITEYDEHWEKYRHTCSRCGNDYTSITKYLENYCSNCGAKMDGERRSE